MKEINYELAWQELRDKHIYSIVSSQGAVHVGDLQWFMDEILWEYTWIEEDEA